MLGRLKPPKINMRSFIAQFIQHKSVLGGRSQEQMATFWLEGVVSSAAMISECCATSVSIRHWQTNLNN